MSTINQYITLPDGRKLGYDEHGKPDGRPLFYFHGTPSARVEWELFANEALTEQLHLRVIAADRPGMGLSDFQPNRRITDWPSDVVALADALSIARFAVLGFSGGTPYAAACALQIPERLTSVGLVSIEAPYEVPGMTGNMNPQALQVLKMSADKPRMAQLIQTMLTLGSRFAPKLLMGQVMKGVSEADQAVLQPASAQRVFMRIVQESARSGTRGGQVDSALMVSPWGFNPADIRLHVNLWQGEQDFETPPAMARYVAAQIADHQLTVYPDEGHISTLVHHMEEITTALAAA
jgi:pimeloyl-ACP methyl ester carboxylesterase